MSRISPACRAPDGGEAGARAAAPAAAGRAPPAPLVSARGLTLQYRTPQHIVTATWRVDFDVLPTDRFVLLGPSGCGKSSILKAVGGFLAPVEGTLTINGRPITRPGPDRMMVFQEFEQLLPWRTVLGNVLFPLRATGRARGRAAVERARDILERVGLGKFTNVYPHMLSGGMKMRVAIARAMAIEPDILLMDEPFAALDALTRRKMQEELLALWDQLRFTMLFVTHSIEEAIIIGSRILVLSPHPGRVRAELNADSFHHGNIDQEAFGALAKRIHRLLFEDGGTGR